MHVLASQVFIGFFVTIIFNIWIFYTDRYYIHSAAIEKGHMSNYL